MPKSTTAGLSRSSADSPVVLPVAAYACAINALSPLVEKFGLVLPSLNGPHSG